MNTSKQVVNPHISLRIRFNNVLADCGIRSMSIKHFPTVPARIPPGEILSCVQSTLNSFFRTSTCKVYLRSHVFLHLDSNPVLNIIATESICGFNLSVFENSNIFCSPTIQVSHSS